MGGMYGRQVAQKTIHLALFFYKKIAWFSISVYLSAERQYSFPTSPCAECIFSSWKSFTDASTNYFFPFPPKKICDENFLFLYKKLCNATGASTSCASSWTLAPIPRQSASCPGGGGLSNVSRSKMKERAFINMKINWIGKFNCVVCRKEICTNVWCLLTLILFILVSIIRRNTPLKSFAQRTLDNNT